MGAGGTRMRSKAYWANTDWGPFCVLLALSSHHCLILLSNIFPWMHIRKHFSLGSALGKDSLQMETALRMWEMRDQTGPSSVVWAQDRDWFETCSISGSSSNWFKQFPPLSKPFWAGLSVNCKWKDCKLAEVISKAGKFGGGEERRRAKQVHRAWPDK